MFILVNEKYESKKAVTVDNYSTYPFEKGFYNAPLSEKEFETKEGAFTALSKHKCTAYKSSSFSQKSYILDAWYVIEIDDNGDILDWIKFAEFEGNEEEGGKNE